MQDPDSDRTKSGRLWVYIGDRNHPWIIYDYTPTHSRDGPAAFLKDYRSFLQADAATFMTASTNRASSPKWAACAHARRYFYEMRASDAVAL